MTARQVWTVFCEGRNLHRPETPVGCGAWIGKEDSKFAAVALAKENGWLTGKTDLCPRHKREAGK